MASGALILYFAYVYLEKGLSTFGVRAEMIGTFAAAAAGLLIFAFLWQSEEADSHKRTVRSLHTVGIVVCSALIFHGIPTATQPEARSGTIGASGEVGDGVEKDGGLTWHLDEEAAYREGASRAATCSSIFSGLGAATAKRSRI